MIEFAKKPLFVIPIVSALVLICCSGLVSGLSLTPEQINLVKNNCVSAKTTLNQLHSSDTLLRVNSGQIYESLATKLMDKFNDRLANNGKTNAAMNSITSSYKTTLDNFRTDYISYEEQITKAYNIDCTAQPELFYAATENARVKRAVLYSDVAILNQKIEEYKALIAALKTEYQANGKVDQ